jgi:hypothetical protein
MKTAFDTYPSPTSLPQASLLPAKTSQLNQEQYRAQNQAVSISLTTREGDQITISQSASNEQMKAKHQNDGSLNKLEASMSAYDMSFAVQGDLSDQELADLSKLLNDLSGIANNFFKGNMKEAMADALSIGDMGSINKLEATFTRTSMLANYMDASHPLPSFAGQPNDLLLQELQDNHATSKGTSIVDSMTAQWCQFLDSLAGQGTLHNRQESSPPANSAQLVGKQMFERAKETMTAHPHLTPLMPSLADLSIDQLLHHYDQHNNTNKMAQDINNGFTKELNSWLL